MRKTRRQQAIKVEVTPLKSGTFVNNGFIYMISQASQVGLVVKDLLANVEDVRDDAGSIPGSGRSPGGGHSNSLQYSCRENAMDRGAWQATVHRVAKKWT